MLMAAVVSGTRFGRDVIGNAITIKMISSGSQVVYLDVGLPPRRETGRSSEEWRRRLSLASRGGERDGSADQ